MPYLVPQFLGRLERSGSLAHSLLAILCSEYIICTLNREIPCLCSLPYQFIFGILKAERDG